ncbi:protein FAR1-RELATED SEQUENCE 5-like [Amaranthus tricolor]|uniref:protein FAR1-RELATED SEQUENCE 5-like n=1 Tax=Amaranthus tricolor TaxID=29722 RepID=UPI002588947A|nr:protein FAR1-RELATED SEQUENCE 5-like [Amaranthus tricolor]
MEDLQKVLNVEDSPKTSNNEKELSEGTQTPRTITQVTPNGSTLWIPHCEFDKKPFVGMAFENLEKALDFYGKYAEICGFDIRSSTTYKKKGIVFLKYFVCSREGIIKPNPKKSADVVARYKRSTKRIGCKARLILKYDIAKRTYHVLKFEEAHNHCLVSPTSRQFLLGNRKMTLLHKNFISKNARVNIGPVKSFRLFKENVGSYENVGVTMQDFKNFHRDLKAYIKGDDGKMLIENFIRKRDIYTGFYFDYALDEEDHISRLFWADAISRKNYCLFGEMVTFDCTYNTNKYSMVLAPFTGVDHHKSCITFGIGLLAKEDSESFEWLFRTFLHCMGECMPTYLITDQDPAMKIAIKNVFPHTIHKLCMWHIMSKVTDKVGPELNKNEDFLKELNGCVWNIDQEEDEFEEKWEGIMTKYNLQTDKWFTSIFSIRDQWIPAYFRDIPLGGILRTTSRSESVNSFFNHFSNPHMTLVEFYMSYESAMDAQRYKQDKLNAESLHTNPQYKTPLPIEKHAGEVYTRKIFFLFQNEVYKSCFKTYIQSIEKNESVESITVLDSTVSKMYKVNFILGSSIDELKVDCDCKLFKRIGILCSHAICVMSARQITQIPKQYVLDRWTKLALKKPIFDLHGNLIEESKKCNNVGKLLGEVWCEIFNCVGLAQRSESDLQSLLQNLKDISRKLEESDDVRVDITKEQQIELLVGTSSSSTMEIQNPIQSKNKGKRQSIIGEKEQTIEQSKKPKRKCKTCGKFDYHDSRNCPSTKDTPLKI